MNTKLFCIFAIEFKLFVMAYDISTYKTVLDKYLTSGVKYLRYIHKSIGKATIYYPIINDAQIKSYLTDQTFKDGTKTYYDKSKPYSEWSWFESNFDIQGLQELDNTVKADYLVLIVGAKASLVELTSENYETKRLLERTVYDIQSFFLLKASKRIARNGSYFYRYAYNHGRFEFGKKRLSFEQIVKIATDKNYTSDSVFIDYLKQVPLNDVDSLLSILLDRHIRGCKGTDTAVSKQDWLNHTLSVFELLKCDTTYQEEIKGKVIQFCKLQIKPTKATTPTNVITAHYSTIRGDVNIEKLYDCLYTEGLIDGQTTKEDFIFFFRGIGNYPTKKIKWNGSNVLLAMLIAKLHQNSLTDWKTTEAVFENVIGNNLKKQSYNNKTDNKNEIFIKQLIQRAK